jgi:DHA2 family multidrug resistance protein-like MFS transporter
MPRVVIKDGTLSPIVMSPIVSPISAHTGEFIGTAASGYLLVRPAQVMPLLPIDLFWRPIFSVSVTTSVLCFIAQGLAFISLPFYLQDVIGVSAVATGLLMTPWPATSALMAPFAGRLADRYPAGILGSIGLAIVAVGFVLLAVLSAHLVTADILWRIAVCGGGTGLFQQPNARAIVMAAPRERSGGTGAIQSSARLLGQSIGAAMVALVFGVSVGGRGAVSALVLAACFAAVATGVSLTRQFDFVRAGRSVSRDRPSPPTRPIRRHDKRLTQVYPDARPGSNKVG